MSMRKRRVHAAEIWATGTGESAIVYTLNALTWDFWYTKPLKNVVRCAVRAQEQKRVLTWCFRHAENAF